MRTLAELLAGPILLATEGLLITAVIRLWRDWLAPAWAWNWETFWPTLIAGMLAFLGSAGLVIVGYLLQRRADRLEDEELYRDIQAQILVDLADLDEQLVAWRNAIIEKDAVPLASLPPLFWATGDAFLPPLLARRNSYRHIRLADVWLEHAKLAASEWNSALAAKGKDQSEAEYERALFAINGALLRVRSASARLKNS